ncbi:Methyltransferase-like protein 5 [Dichanthelium oligosanthes]|uniref:Methyltransferase-like protein 5 n=1 Tax=Dichanthelium oligosanthes TaxID=888268 RepID=A0A1E5W5X3_9POAL|nr:Methyltransferase-like protein 5 [Dichanthelium oligosanthes]
MKLKQLEGLLGGLTQFPAPKVELEQYPTGPHIASRMLYTVSQCCTFDSDAFPALLREGRMLSFSSWDGFGMRCGGFVVIVSGIMELGAIATKCSFGSASTELLGYSLYVVIYIDRHVIGIDIDPQALELAQQNAADLELDIDLIWSGIKNLNLKVFQSIPSLLADRKIFGAGFHIDTVVMNPPFGTRKKGADMEFLSMGLKVASQAVYSLHKTSTREHIKKTALRDYNAIHAEVLCELRYDLPQTYKFHKKKEVDIAVDLWRFVPNARRSSS